MKLYHFPISPNSRRVIAALHHLNLECELHNARGTNEARVFAFKSESHDSYLGRW
jgi:glutathione S-transferase